MNISTRTFKNIKNKNIKRYHSSSNKDDYMLVSGCIGGIIGMFCDYKFPKSDTYIGVPYIIAFSVTAMTFYVFSPILIPGGMLILIDMGMTYCKKNRE